MKAVPRERFASVAERGVVFARANLSMRLDDHQSENATFLADTGDFLAVPDPVSYAPVPYREATARVHAFMRSDDGSPWEGCPRSRLAHLVEALAAKGLRARVGFEPECMLFEPGADGEYRPIDAGGMFTLAGIDRYHGMWKALLDDLREMGVAVEQLGKEYGPGQFEGTTRYDEPGKAVDDYLTFKEVVRAHAREAGFIASFMPKPYADGPGCGLHLHISLWDRAGEREVSLGETDEQPLSEVGGQFVAGLLAHARGLTGIGSPIVNSYKRLQPGSWAPAHVCWGVGNRSALVRIPGLGPRRHLEYRSGDNAANPFMYLTALLAAGLDGVENDLELPPPADVDVGHLTTSEALARGLEFLPSSLTEALGPVISKEFLIVKRSELAAYSVQVHPWERRMYLESI